MDGKGGRRGRQGQGPRAKQLERVSDEERFRIIADHSRDWEMWVAPDGAIDYISPSCHGITGYAPEEFRQDPKLVARIIHPADRLRVERHPCPLASGTESSCSLEFRIVRRDGQERRIQHACVEMRSRKGSCLGVRVSNRDVTEWRRAEEALRRSEIRYRSLAEANIVGVFVSEGYHIVEANDMFLEILGLTRADFGPRGLDWRQIARDYGHSDRRAIREMLNTGKAQPFEKEFHRADGTEVCVLLAAALISRRPFHWMAFSLDLTRMKWAQGQVERLNLDLLRKVSDLKVAQEGLEAARDAAEKAARELARSNQDLEKFAYIASHDLQEPLRTVTGYVQLLLEHCGKQLDDQASGYLANVNDGAQRMRTLIEDLLAYSRAGSQRENHIPVPVDQVVDGVLASLQAGLQESGAEVTRDSLPVVEADPTQLTQLLQNLIGNALKFRGPEQPRIHIHAEARNDHWLFSVADNGIGIEPRFHERIFLIFQRLHTRREYPGTGVGLAVCKRIVERHGGRIWVESQPGQGAVFYFTLPRET